MDEGDSVIWHLIVGSRGGPARLLILGALRKRPYNANQLTGMIGMDYKTVRHHLEILVENGLITVSREKRYGELYHLSDYARGKLKAFDGVLRRLGGDLG
jgi:DNA-binding transcriptional ArsR family regulator